MRIDRVVASANPLAVVRFVFINWNGRLTKRHALGRLFIANCVKLGRANRGGMPVRGHADSVDRTGGDGIGGGGIADGRG